jgi:DNA-binding CsgD family transcriptional regulator/tetratricopeptide (TPR) repeat protein
VVTGDWPLTGRAEELRLVAEVIRAAGKTPGMVVAGAAGVGKTRLAREALTAAAALGVRTRWIVASQSAKALPLGAFTEIASDFGPDPLRRVREVMGALIGEDGDERVVIGIDDAHLLDDMSALVVHQLALSKLARVVITVRSGEPAPDVITSLWKDRRFQRVDLLPLSLEETSVLLEAVLGGDLDSLSARRLWALTHGNVLYLRQLVEDERSTGRLKHHAGVWIWDGAPVISAGLGELVATRMGRLSPAVGDVVDALALCEPLDAAVLGRVADGEAVEAAETAGLITHAVEGHRRRLRLAHPLFGEVRRAGSGALRMSRIRGQIATELAAAGDVDMRDTVRRAVLTLDSDLPPDPALFLTAGRGAMQLLDLNLAERLVDAAVRSGAGVEAQTLWAITLASLGRGDEAQRVLGELQRSGFPDSALATISAVRAAIVLWVMGRPSLALHILDSAKDSVRRSGAEGPHAALRGSLWAVAGSPMAAIWHVGLALSEPLDDFHTAIATFALVISLGELGRVEEMRAAATRAVELAMHSTEASQLRFMVGVYQAAASRIAGELAELAPLGTRLREHFTDMPGALPAQVATFVGQVELALGRLTSAARWHREARAELAMSEEATVLRCLNLMWLTEALGKLGDAGAAREAAGELDLIRPSGFAYLDTGCAVATAWVCAAEGAVSEAIAITRDAADTAHKRGQPANEVFCLQTATQFGDHSGAQRLAELADQVQGARAPAAAAHAIALAGGDGAALQQVSRDYDALGDRVAAADAAAQAAVAYAANGLRGAALTAHAAARRLASDCCCADTPALRTLSEPPPFTGRQREILRLATHGLSNRQIAQRLSVSLRTVEGHLYRASRRVAVSSRDDLLAMLEGKI